MQIVSFSRSKMNQNVIFRMRIFFQNLTCTEKILNQNLTRCICSNPKSNALYFFSIENLTRCKTFKSKSDVFDYFYLKIWHVVKFFIQNLPFKSFFFRFLLKYCQSAANYQFVG